MDWLKTILGDSYTDDIGKKVSDEVGKRFVSRDDFNETNTAKKQLEAQVKQHTQQLEDLQKSAGNDEQLKQKIAELQELNKNMQLEHEQQIKTMQLDSAVEKALMGAHAKNLTASKALLAEFLESAEVDDKGNVRGLSEAISGLQKSEETSFLFADTTKGTTISGATPANPDKVAPGGKSTKDMTYEELSSYLSSNPGAALE